MSVKPKKSWREKLADSKGLPRVIPITGRMSLKWGTGTVVIPAPLEVDALMRQVPRGKVVTINRLRAALARRHGATIACPITTGIFAWIAANAAVEAQAAGRKRITPWWRTLKGQGELNPKFPGGVEAQARLLRAEGHVILPAKGKKPPQVADVANRLAL
jgi:alkylated DNA nucleotide flippase Atl1